LTALQARGEAQFDFDALSKVVDGFSQLQEEYGWGTNLPYMVSGANSLPQKDVMEWVGKRLYSFNSIIRALHNQAKGVQDNEQLPVFDQSVASGSRVMIVGGGPSVVHHAQAITHYLQQNEDIVVVHASSKNAMALRDIRNRQVFCLVGNEGHRMEDVFAGKVPGSAICVLPPFPRKMGTYIPAKLRKAAYQLPQITFSDKFIDSHTAIALQTCLELGANQIDIAGYDGYSGKIIGQKEQELIQENEHLFRNFSNKTSISLHALLPSGYDELISTSIYTKL
jgi:4-hydroxy 2-oxovalerate aldolase